MAQFLETCEIQGVIRLFFGLMIGIGDNAYAPQPRDLRFSWKIHITSTLNRHHQQPIDVLVMWIFQHKRMSRVAGGGGLKCRWCRISNANACRRVAGGDGLTCWWCGIFNTNASRWVEVRVRCHLCPIIVCRHGR